jgi:hypothetical protein
MIDLEFVTDDERITTICELYWEIDSSFGFAHNIAELADLAKVNKTELPRLVKKNCNARVLNWNCDDCGKPYIFTSRSDFLNKRRYFENPPSQPCAFVCSDCQAERRRIEEQKRIERIRQENEERERTRRELRTQIREVYDLSRRPLVDVDQLSFYDVVYLTTILVAGAYENLTKIMPLTLLQQPLAPTQEFTTEIARHLHDKNLIYVHPDTEPEAFPEGHTGVFYIWKVYYAPPVFGTDPDDPASVLRELYKRINSEWPSDWYQAAFELWQRVALEECIEYLLFVLNEHHFEFNPGKKTRQYLEFALGSFSTAQVFNIIWRAAKDAAAYYQRAEISKKLAANSAIASIRRSAERAIAEGWELKPFGRNYQCPQTHISHVLYNTTLKLGEKGFGLPPSLESVKAKDAPKEKSTLAVYHSSDLVDKWGYDPDIVLGEYGADQEASHAQIDFILALAEQFPEEANELEKVINAYTQDNPFRLSNCKKGQAKWIIGQLLALKA